MVGISNIGTMFIFKQLIDILLQPLYKIQDMINNLVQKGENGVYFVIISRYAVAHQRCFQIAKSLEFQG